MRLSFLSTLLPFTWAFHSPHTVHHRRLRRAPLLPDESLMSSLTLSSTSILPTFLTSLANPLPSSPSPSSFSPSSSPPDPAQSTPTSSSTLPPSTSTTPTPSSASSNSRSVPLPSSIPSSTAPTSTVVSTSSTQSAPIVFSPSQPSSSSFTSMTLQTPTQDSSSAVGLTSTIATPSSTATQSSSSGFFSNTSAVAGTFAVVGLFGIAGVIAVGLLIARRRHSRSHEEDTEYLDKSPDLFGDPPITQVTSLDDGSNSDHAHFSAPPMPLATLPAAYYPDHAYALHPQAFSSEAYPPLGPHGYSSSYPVASTQEYAAQRIYSPEDYDIAYPPPAPRVATNMPNPHEFTDVELVSAPIPPTQTALPNALRPSVKSTPSAPEQWESARFSVDSFYAGIAADTPPHSGRAL